MALRKAGANWVEGPDRFFDREIELEALAERARDGTHTLLTAQRRMGKTSLVRELLRRLAAEGTIETVFVDLEDAADAADAIAAIGAEAKSVEGAWRRIGCGGRATESFRFWRRATGRSCWRSTNYRSSSTGCSRAVGSAPCRRANGRLMRS